MHENLMKAHLSDKLVTDSHYVPEIELLEQTHLEQTQFWKGMEGKQLFYLTYIIDKNQIITIHQ